MRRNSDYMTRRIDHIFLRDDFITHHGDITDSANIYSLLSKIAPDEIYNLAAQSHVAVSFDVPEYSANTVAIGALRLLSAIKDLGLSSRFYQASSSEMFGGKIFNSPQNEWTPLEPQSPYASAKAFAYWTTRNYRDAYDIHASNGILFNHESPRRGYTFVTKKITKAIANLEKGSQEALVLGNLDSSRDWGYAKEYVEGMWRILQHDVADDFVLGTGVSTTVRDFVTYCFEAVGKIIIWQGEGKNEIGVDLHSGKTMVVIDERHFRPNEVDYLCADASKAEKILGWKAKVTIKELAKLMVDYDLMYEEYGHDISSDG